MSSEVVQFAADNKNQLVKFIAKYTKSREDADDVFQQLVIRLMENKYDVDKIKPFVYQAAKNMAFNFIKRDRLMGGKLERFTGEFDIADNHTPESLMIQEQSFLHINSAVESLLEVIDKKHVRSNNRNSEGQYKTIRLMMNSDNQYNSETAEEAGINYATFKTQYRLALIKLREKINPEGFYIDENSVVFNRRDLVVE